MFALECHTILYIFFFVNCVKKKVDKMLQTKIHTLRERSEKAFFLTKYFDFGGRKHLLP